MTTDIKEPTVAGERLSALVGALLQIKLEERPNGSWAIDGTLDRESGAPFVAALMRVEAELLAAYAIVVAGGGEPRTDEQRRADALVELAVRVGAARATSGL